MRHVAHINCAKPEHAACMASFQGFVKQDGLHPQETIDQYMAGLIPAGGDPIPPDVADETCEGEDEETIQDFSEFKRWLEGAAAEEQAGPVEPIACPSAPPATTRSAASSGDGCLPASSATAASVEIPTDTKQTAAPSVGGEVPAGGPSYHVTKGGALCDLCQKTILTCASNCK